MTKLAEKVAEGNQEAIDEYQKYADKNEKIVDKYFNKFMSDRETIRGSSGIVGDNTASTATRAFNYVPGKGLVPNQ